MPNAAALDERTDDENVRNRPEGRQVVRRDARPDGDGQLHRAADGADVFDRHGLTGGRARDDEGIGDEKGGGLGRVGDIDVGGQGVARVLLLDVGENTNVLRANFAAVAQEMSSVGFERICKSGFA